MVDVPLMFALFHLLDDPDFELLFLCPQLRTIQSQSYVIDD